MPATPPNIHFMASSQSGQRVGIGSNRSRAIHTEFPLRYAELSGMKWCSQSNLWDCACDTYLSGQYVGW
jgi:hypothetical protein